MQYVKYVVAAIVLAGLAYIALVGLGEFTPEAFAGLTAALIAMAFEFFSFLREDFDKLSPTAKQLVIVGLNFIVVALAFGLSCAALLMAFTCDQAGALNAFTTFILAVVISFGMHGATKYILNPKYRKAG